MLNSINTWQQGKFVDHAKYDHMGQEWKDEQNKIESFLVRPYPTENAICKTTTPQDAKWIASRLNLAADMEQLAYDFAIGKTNGDALKEYVLDALRKI
jgi:hypothetical protein